MQCNKKNLLTTRCPAAAAGWLRHCSNTARLITLTILSLKSLTLDPHDTPEFHKRDILLRTKLFRLNDLDRNEREVSNKTAVDEKIRCRESEGVVNGILQKTAEHRWLFQSV